MTGAPIRVVIADDSSDIRLLLRMTLSHLPDFEVAGEAADGVETIEVVGRTVPDAVILDLAMPVMDGLQVIPQLRTRAPNMKILVVSGFTRAGMQEEAFRLGAHAYVEKGKPPDAIAAALRALCEGSEASTEMTVSPTPGLDNIPQEVLSVLAHELSSPVAVIRGFASALRNEAQSLSSEEASQFIDAIMRGADQVAALISAFIDVRGVDADALNLELEDTDAGRFVREVVQDQRPHLEGRAVSVTAPTWVRATFDRVRVHQVLVNLLTNAGKFSPAGTPIEVTAREVDGELEIAVRDHGPGIPEDMRERAFLKFSRLRTGTPGMGLGLYIARGIARAHGGELTYESPGDVGGRFVFRLPLRR